MIDFIVVNIVNILIGIAVFSAIALIVLYMVKGAKKGESPSCGCGCKGCSSIGGNDKKN